MGRRLESVGDHIIDFASNVRSNVRDSIAADKAQECEAEREWNIEKAAEAMLDAGLTEEVVLAQLQKFWDLRRSEAERYISWAVEGLSETKK